MRLSRKPLLVVALLGMGVAVPALAQQPSSYPPACETSKVSKSDVDRAHTVFLSGKGFLDEANYDKAISYFKDAYSIDCSVHAILPIIATAYERKGDKGSAVQALQEYLKRVPNASDREVIERRIKNLQDQMTPVPVASTPPTPATSAPTVTAAPTAPATTVTPSGSGPPTSTGAVPPSETTGGHGVAPWVLVGVGGAALLTGVVVYIVGAGKVSNAESVCGTNHVGCPPGSPAITDGNSGRTLELVGGIAGGVGLAAVAGGLVWHFMEPTGSSRTTGASVTPVLAPGYAGMGLGGHF
jgi:hypothetical protein